MSVTKFFEFSKFEPIKSFYLKDDLNRKVWNKEDKLKPEIRKSLIQIATDFIDNLELDIEIKDIILTGSLANYNWSEYSDFDLHILFDFLDINKDIELVRRLLDAEEKLWKYRHDIQIEGYEVEVYPQNISDPHTSSGQYSIMRDKWIVKPTKENFVPDEDLIKKKAQKITDVIDEIDNDFDENMDYVEIKQKIKKIWKKIKDSRKAGLEKEGEYSVENLVFKLLRRNGYIKRLLDIKTKAYDKQFNK